MGYVVCGGCSLPVPTSNWNSGGPIPCAACGRGVDVRVFPAAIRQAVGAAPEAIVTGEEASCYNHTMYKAIAPCDACGQFLCALCDIPIAGMHVCPSCFETGKGETLERSRLQERTNFDSIALALVTLPTLLCWLPIFTTPAGLYFLFKHWNDPSSVFPRGTWRQWLTIVFAVLQVALYAAITIGIVRNWPRGLE